MQPMSRRILPTLLLLSTTLLAACGGGDKGTGPDDTPVNPFLTPRGTALVLPTNVSIQGTLEGVSLFGELDEASPCHSSVAGEAGFSYEFVNVCIRLRNAGASATTVTLPTGLEFVSQDADVQNGLVVQPIQIVVPGSRDTTVVVHIWCVNEHRGASTSGMRYTLGPVTNVADINEIASLLVGKRLDDDAVGPIQEAVWDVSDRGGLTNESRDALRALANAAALRR